MTSTETIHRRAAQYVADGRMFEELKRWVSYRTESSNDSGRVALKEYLGDVLIPELTGLGCETELFESWRGGPNSFLIGARVESENLPTLLCYGHADVVDGQGEAWSDGRSPWTLESAGDRWYGRGTADNKGQHLVNLAALRILLEERGQLGFNVKFLFECGEELGSPMLAEFATANSDKLAADVFIASDGPRLSAETPTIFLGARGSASFTLDVKLRESSYHSGNWGGLLRNPGTTLAAAIGTLVDGHGRIQLPALLPPAIPQSVLDVIEELTIPHSPGDPEIDLEWSDTNLSPAEKVYGWNTLELLAFGTGDIHAPINAIPASARAVFQLRFVVGTVTDNLQSVIQNHLDRNGFGMVRVGEMSIVPASRLDPANAWVDWARTSIERAIGTAPTVLPNIGGGLPNHVFEEILGLPTLWIPHSYPGCQQHAPDEHMLESIATQGLQIACGLFHDLGNTTDLNHPFFAPSEI